MKVSCRKLFCLPLACLLALTACAQSTGASAEPVPIEVPRPVEQTNEVLTIFYTDADELQTSILDAAVTLYNQEHPDQLVTVEKIFTDDSDTVRDNETRQMLTEVMAGEGTDPSFFIAGSKEIEKMARSGGFGGL